MSDPVLLFALIVSMGASFFFSGVETGIYALNRVRLRLRSEGGDRAALRVRELVKRPHLLISTILIGNHLANYGATFFCQGLLGDRPLGVEADIMTTLILTPVLFVVGEITPKNLFRIRANDLVYSSSQALRVACIALRPLALPLRWLGAFTRALPRSSGGPDGMLSRRRLEVLAREGAEDGVLTRDQEGMVRNVLRLSSIPVEAVMVRLDAVDFVATGFSREDVLGTSSRNARSRLPVMDPELGRPIGVVSVLDLVYRPDEPLTDLVSVVPEIPGTTAVGPALRVLRNARTPMGFVESDAGDVIGIVTLKDLVEEVSGELPAF